MKFVGQTSNSGSRLADCHHPSANGIEPLLGTKRASHVIGKPVARVKSLGRPRSHSLCCDSHICVLLNQVV
jgi:hypothetical protein